MTYAFNTVTNSGNYGLEAQDGKGPVLIMNNTISNTTSSYEFGGYGIMTRGSSGIATSPSWATPCPAATPTASTSARPPVSICEDNTVTGSTGKGINNSCGSGCTVSNNTESNNSGGN